MVAFALLLFLAAGQTAPTAQRLKGAEKIIAAMGGSGAADPLGAEAAKKVEAKIKAFGAVCERLAPADAAAKWFALFEEASKKWKSEDAYRPETLSAETAMGALPPPSAWPPLKALIYSKTMGLNDRRSIELRLFAELLTNDLKAAEASIVSLLQPKAGSERDDALTLYTELAEGSGDRALMERAVSEMMDAVARHSAVNDNWEGLPELLGETKATEVFRKIIDIDPALLDGVEGRESRKIILKLILERPSKISKPLWKFASHLDAAAMYPVFAKRWLDEPAGGFFPTDDAKARTAATIAYALSLEIEGKHTEAVALADDAAWQATEYDSAVYTNAARNEGVAQAYLRLMVGVAAKHPEKVEWGSTLTAAETCGNVNEVLDPLKIRLALGHFADGASEDTLMVDYVDALIAADKTELAVTEMHRLMSRAEYFGPNYSSQMRFSENILRIGRLTGRPALIEEGVADLRKVRPEWILEDRGGDRPAESLVRLRVTLGQASCDEDDFVQSVADSHKRYLEEKSGSSRRFGGIPDPSYAPLLVNFVHLYWILNRPKDVVDLLQKSPGWGVDDLTQIQDFVNFGRGNDPNAEFYAAWALNKTGDKAKAVEIITHFLHQNLDFDPAYEVLLDAQGLAALPVLDELAHRNPGIARPLIWKAVALHEAKQDKEAETVIRQAIALDPCDGNAWFDQWQKAYSVLADIRAAEGDQTGEAALRHKVQAAPLMEQGDDLAEAGLTTRSIVAYSEAAAFWPDSALIQIKLAVQQEKMGQADEAAKHYETGFALLPDQLGRRDPVRLEFDKLFALPIATRIAETSLTEQLKSNKRIAEANYLLGKLCLVRGRRLEGVQHLVAALKADPAYVMAGDALEDENGELLISSAEADSFGLTLSRLDPNHHRFVEGSITMDKSAIYEAAYAAAKQDYQPPSRLWRLEASARENAATGTDLNRLLGRNYESEEKIDPREVAANTVAFTRALRWVVDWLSKGGGI